MGSVHNYHMTSVESKKQDIFIVKFKKQASVMHDNKFETDWMNMPHFKDSVFVGVLPQNIGKKTVGMKASMLLPQNEQFYVTDSMWVNYQEQSAAFMGCTKCWSLAKWRQGVHTYRFSGLSFINTTRRINVHKKELYWDMDGSLTGIPNSYTTWADAFNLQHPGCDYTQVLFNETEDNVEESTWYSVTDSITTEPSIFLTDPGDYQHSSPAGSSSSRDEVSMVKTSAGGYRAARKLRQRGSAVEEASQTCAWRRPLFWITSAGAVFIWTALVIFNWRVLAEDGPKMSGEVSLQSKVLALERDLNRAKEDLAQKDQLLAAYRETKDLAKERARPQPPKPEANLRGFTSSSDSPSPVIQGFATCTFQEDADYSLMGGRGREEVVKEKSNKAECCQLCLARNQLSGGCTVAVLSSAADVPPSACWIKTVAPGGRSAGLKPFRKIGVVSCLPQGENVPTLPPAPDTGVLQDHEKGLLALQQLPASGGALARANAVKDSIRHAWSNYKQYAWGMDELLPVAGKGRNRGFNLAITMVDSLDTLWLAGLREDFHEAKDWLASNFPQKIDAMGNAVSVFETTIRALGGLLSAYDLSKDKAFLTLAEKLTKRELSQWGLASMVQEIKFRDSLLLEMRYLSHATGDDVFALKTMKFYDTVKNFKSLEGLWPNCFEKERGKITLGADGDSFYEYLLKVWLQGGQQESEQFLKAMYDDAVRGVQKHMVRKGTDGLTYLGTVTWDSHTQAASYTPEMEHLMCFVPGWLALGSRKPGTGSREIMNLADALAYTCWQMYEQQPTGISPERVKGEAMDLSKTNTREYILRPEAAEGWWYMLELTEDAKYREWGWKAFLAFEKWLWVPHGYASLKDVRSTSKTYLDRMESFFIAETQKYLLLLQDVDHEMKLDRYVFNTEAHPLSILK
ncbi:unnamed protein product [Effrenium voratum]|nr:unnamed protein product [Effrenium voratum]